MVTPFSARPALRDATSHLHDRVDAVFSSTDLTTREGYARFLLAQAAAHIPVEAALTAAGVAAVIPDWPGRTRAAALRADLAAMGLAEPAPEPAATAIAFAGDAAMLGAVYVLEGARLGGALLRRSVPAALPSAFLTPGDSAAWRGLLAILDARLRTDEDIHAAVEAAGRVFAVFEASGRRLAGVGVS